MQLRVESNFLLNEHSRVLSNKYPNISMKIACINRSDLMKKAEKMTKNGESANKVQKKGLKNKNKTNIRVDKVEKGDIMKLQKQMFVVCSEVILWQH